MKFLKSLSIYSIVSMYQAVLIFCAILIFSSLMEIEEFAIYNLYLALVPFIMNLILLGVPGSSSVYFHKFSKLKFKLYLGQIIFFILPFSFLLSILLYLIFTDYLVAYFNLNNITILILILFCFFQILPQILFKYYQTSHDPKSYFYFNTLYLTGIFIFNVIAFFIFDSIISIFVSSLCVSFVFSLVTFIILKSNSLLMIKFNIIAIK